jgi:hypothetical protein
MNELRSIGSTNFMMKYLRDDAHFKLEEILYAFGYLVVRVLHNISYTSLMSLKFLPRRLLLAVELADNRRIALLRVAVDAELHRRRKLPHVNTIDDVVNLIKSSEKIIVLAGAGNLYLYCLTSRHQHQLWYSRLSV